VNLLVLAEETSREETSRTTTISLASVTDA